MGSNTTLGCGAVGDLYCILHLTTVCIRLTFAAETEEQIMCGLHVGQLSAKDKFGQKCEISTCSRILDLIDGLQT